MGLFGIQKGVSFPLNSGKAHGYGEKLTIMAIGPG